MHLRTQAHTEEAVLKPLAQAGTLGPRDVCRRLGARQVPVEVEAEEAGEQLAGCGPPDEEGEDGAEEEGREQAAQRPSDPGRRLLGLILPGAPQAILG